MLLPKCGLGVVQDHAHFQFPFSSVYDYFKENYSNVIREHVLSLSWKIMDIPVSELDAF